MNCPFCSAENIDGADVCEHCQEPIDFLSQPAASGLEGSLMRDSITTIMSTDPAILHPQQPVWKALDLLSSREIGCVVVVEFDRIVGIFTERDALERLNADAESLRDHPISQFMTKNPETVPEDAEIMFALHKMDVGGYRHLPVLRGGSLVGVLSARHIFQYIGDRLVTFQ